MKWIHDLWESISDFSTHDIPEQEKRSIIILNRVNFFLMLTAFVGMTATIAEYWLIQKGKPGLGTLRLGLMMASGMVSFMITARRWHRAAKIVTSTFPFFFLIIFPTLLGDVKIEYYFYYPPAGIALTLIPILLFPRKKDRILLISLVLAGFVLSIASDNLLSFFSDGIKSADLYKGRYAFYKIAEILIFMFIILVVYTLTDINTKYEAILADQNRHLGITNQELETFKNHLEELVESRTTELSASELRFRSIFENANDAIIIMKEDAFYEFNQKTVEIFGCSKEDIVGKTPQMLSPIYQIDGRHSGEKVKEKITAALEGMPQRFEWLYNRLNGGHFEADVSLSILHIGSDDFLLAIVRDITERKKSERALIESERKFSNIFNKTRNGILILGPDVSVLDANKAVMDILGLQTDTDSPLNGWNMMPPGFKKLIAASAAMINKGENPGPVEYNVRFQDGQMHTIEAESSAMDYHGEPAILVILRDVSHLKEAEQKVLEAIIQTEENERSRIAQDLHDGLGPVLSTIKIYFQVLLDTEDLIKKEELIEKLKSTIEEAIKSISEISHNISPHVLKNYGFYAALRQFIHRITLINVTKITFNCTEEYTLSPNTGITLYRTITELINNSLKHADCSNISIGITRNESSLEVHYTDNGKGFDIHDALGKSAHGSGVQNMINRIKALQGKIDISGKRGKGMKALIIIPMTN